MADLESPGELKMNEKYYALKLEKVKINNNAITFLTIAILLEVRTLRHSRTGNCLKWNWPLIDNANIESWWFNEKHLVLQSCSGRGKCQVWISQREAASKTVSQSMACLHTNTPPQTHSSTHKLSLLWIRESRVVLHSTDTFPLSLLCFILLQMGYRKGDRIGLISVGFEMFIQTKHRLIFRLRRTTWE